MRYLILILLVVFSIEGFRSQQIIDKVIAVVGKYPVLYSDLEAGIVQKQKEGEIADRCKTMEDLVYQKLLLAQADKDSVVVSDAEVDAEVSRRLAYYINMIGGEDKFEAFYGKRTNVFKDEIRPDVHDQLVAQKMQQKVSGDIKLTPSEVRIYFNSIPSDSLPLINTEIEISQIVKKPPVSEAAKKETRAILETYRQRVIKGESMSVLAALYSEDPGSAKNGGRYESVMRGMMVPEFESVAFRLKPGEVSEVFETSYGFHFIELIARKGESVDVRHILLTPKMTQLDLLRCKDELDSIQKLILENKISFEDAARKFSDDKETKQNGGLMINPNTGATKWENEDISHLDQNLVFMLGKMEVGDVTTPMNFLSSDQKPGYRIITIKSRIDPHKANMKDDYSRLLQMATFERQKKNIKEWIEKKSKSTYIKIDPEFLCKFEHKWVISN